MSLMHVFRALNVFHAMLALHINGQPGQIRSPPALIPIGGRGPVLVNPYPFSIILVHANPPFYMPPNFAFLVPKWSRRVSCSGIPGFWDPRVRENAVGTVVLVSGAGTFLAHRDLGITELNCYQFCIVGSAGSSEVEIVEPMGPKSPDPAKIRPGDHLVLQSLFPVVNITYEEWQNAVLVPPPPVDWPVFVSCMTTHTFARISSEKNCREEKENEVGGGSSWLCVHFQAPGVAVSQKEDAPNSRRICVVTTTDNTHKIIGFVRLPPADRKVSFPHLSLDTINGPDLTTVINGLNSMNAEMKVIGQGIADSLNSLIMD